MRSRRLTVTALSMAAVLGVAAAWANPDKPVLDTKLFALRLRLGLGDRQPQTWSGRVRVDHGEVVGVEGWRFRQGDRVVGRDAWEASSRLIRRAVAKKKAAAKQAAARPTGPSTLGPEVTPNGVIVTLKAPADATLTVETDRGNFPVPLADIADGTIHRYLDGKAEAQRVPVSIPVREWAEQDDFPAAAADEQGGVWVVSVHHAPRGPEVLESFNQRPKTFADFVPDGGGDQVMLFRFANGQAGDSLPVTEPGRDVWRPAVAVDDDGRVVVAWSENQDGNWDIYSRVYSPEKNSWSAAERVTTSEGTDTHVVLQNVPKLGVWMAWQAWAKGTADIFVKAVSKVNEAGTRGGSAGSNAIQVTSSAANEWSPSLACDKDGHLYVAYDTYREGNYDVLLTRLNLAGEHGGMKTVRIATSDKYETRPSVAVDARQRVWVAYEERTSNWGKDAENLLDGKGSSLYRASAVRVRCVDGDHVYEAPDPVGQAPQALTRMNGFPRLAIDRSGRPWLAFRHRQEAVWGNNAVLVAGAVWLEYVASLEGKTWSVPQVLPRSDGLLDNRPALAQPSDGPMLVFYNSDGRLRHEVEFQPQIARRYWPHSGTPQGVVDNDLEVAALVPNTERGRTEPNLTEPPATEPPAPPVHRNEAEDIARLRDYRVKAAGKTYQLLRGEFHRHSEVSQDGGSDGALEDMWRYAIDAAQLDWIGNGDHDNGGSREYTWWLVQKTTDMYTVPPLFVPMFCYERSVSYPHGHRNVMFARRGIRTLPRLMSERGVSDDDTKMLYDYLNELGGICASHTSGTGMGTDWRDNNRRAEPVVEIFQGHRNSYEHLGAPRVARRESEAIGGWRPLGMVWNALAMQYRLGFQASSDHISTHISYAVALAEDHTRSSILDAFRRRHCYGATDNILLDVRCGEHIMGDEFDADGPVRIKVAAHGTGPIARLDIIKDFIYVYSTEPNTDSLELEWTDEERRPAGLSWYYVRVLQKDGQIAWGSPMWLHLKASTSAGQ